MLKDFTKGILTENPVFGLMLGLCPTLAISVSIKNAVGMGAAATFVLFFSNIGISLFGRFFPSKIRIPCYIVVIATFVSVVEMLLGAYLPALNNSLGIFIPLIVVNCIILGRAEAFAAKNGVFPSMLDALGMGTGFTLGLVFISVVREVLGSGKFWDMTIADFYSSGGSIMPASVVIMAPGAFIIIALMMAYMNLRRNRK